MPRVRPEDVIAAPGNALLIVDHPDRRAGGVPVIADRMTVDRRRQAFGFRGPERTRQRLISGCAQLRVLHRQVLAAIRRLESVLEPLRCVGLTRPQQVRVVLRVGGEAEIHDSEIAVQHVAALDDVSARRRRRRQTAFAPYGERRMEPLSVAHFGDALPHPPRDVLVRRDAGHDDAIRKRFRDHLVRHAHHVTIGVGLLRQLRFEPPDGEHLGRFHSWRVLGTERLHEIVALVRRQPVRVVVVLGRIHADRFRVARFDDFSESIPLAVVVGLLEREQAVVIEAADRQMLDRTAAAVEEDENGAPARRIRRDRRHRREYGIVVVLPGDDHPHVDPLAPHQRRQKRLETLLDPLMLERRLFAMGENAVDGQRLCRGEKRRERLDC